MNFGVIVFPGSNCDHDCVHVLSNVLSQKVREVWHKETSLDGLDAVILPGGLSYGDYLRTGAIARFSPVMGAVKHFADHGGMVLGICNGLQILLEAVLLPGLMPHPERCAEEVLGNDDGRLIFLSMLDALKQAKLQPKTLVG